MKVGYVDEEAAERDSIEPGWYVYDQSGRRMQGPFGNRSQAEAWIKEQQPRRSPGRRP